MSAPHLADPRTPLVALEGGPMHRRWFHYADWLALRSASRRGGYPRIHPCGSCRCYLPTERYATNPNPMVTHRHGDARVWTYVVPEQWQQWAGREYLTPEEKAAGEPTRVRWPVTPEQEASA
ncbi:hypothetical protein JOF41_006376 [Saccharothrix coeruleofusca]|uniref:hypothetical protein n=1 Tax=Saccharothrix coeruleofusca TaxID=33919 RepID=UPI001AE7FF65|nr:hypothetical protein [Saccharothrix coeruleofusca]MBP2340198.1 hypothetical protein [Saccharothrix coeruleofusca]